MAFRLVGNKFVDTNDPQFQMYNALGRDAGQQTDNRNFFERRASSIGNAVGTTLSAPISIAHDVGENIATQNFLGDSKARMKSIANKYGYDSWSDWQDAYAEVKNSGDEAKKAQMDEQLKEFQAQANANANEATAKAKGYEDYRQNNLISKNINQDRGKFAGSAINTLSTMADVMLPTAGVAFNAVQGGIEGVADELEQNGLENFDWNRAGQNALVGTVTGGVVGGLNKGLQGISSQLARGGGNAVTRGLSKLGAKHPIMSNLAAGAARGALSGAVGGATGAGLSSALNGVEFGQGVQNALQGAAQGAKSGAFTGSVMAGANMALNATPGVGNVMRNLNQAGEDWKKSGSNFNERLTNTLTSGDSKVGNWLMKDTQTPTTAAGWLRQAGERVAEGVNSRGVGLGIKDVAGEQGDSTTDAQFDSYVNANNKINEFLEADSEGIPQTAPAYAKVEAAYDDAVKTLRDTYTDAQLADMLRGGAKPKVKSLVKAAMELPATSNVPEDVRSMKINDYSAENSAEEYTPTEVASTQPTQEAPTTAQAARPTAKYDAWDRLAQEYGYETYDDVINDYMAANPYAKINPNGMAGQILGWLDRQKTPTTLGGWVKKASERVTDELNQRGAGLSIKDTAESPETEVYRTLNKTAQTPEEVAEITTEIPQKPTGEQIKNKRLLVQEIQGQFNTVDTPTARGTKPNETFYNLYEDYGLSDGDDIRQAVAYADPGSLLPKMISEAAGEAGIIDLSDAQALVMDLKLKKQANYTRTLNALEDLMDSTETTIIGGKAGVDALQFQRALEQAASDARGSNGTYHIGKNLVDETMAKNFDRIAKNIGAKLDDAAVQKGAVQKVVRNHSADLQAMRNAFPDNTKWQENFVDKVAGAEKISDLRHSIKDLTRANIYIRNGDEKFSTVGSTVARNGGLRGLSTDIPTTKGTLINRAVNYVADKIYNTDGARNARLEKYDQKIKGDNVSANASNTNLANSQDGASTSLYNALSRGSGAGAATSDSVKTSVAALPTQAYNAIGRREGATNAEQARTSNYIADAVENANTLEDLAVPAYSTNATSVYNSIYGNPNSTSGDYWTSVLGDAMNMAMAAGDADAFAQLYSMYQSAASKQTSASETKLTDKQRQANAAARALADFEQAEPNFGYDVSDIPVIGGIANWGGNEYQSKAEALALQIGYMLSGATVNKDEARKIGMSYVPQPRDSEAVRKSKLAQLRGIITDYQQTYAE